MPFFKRTLDGIFTAKEWVRYLPFRFRSARQIRRHLRVSAGAVRVNIGCGANLLPGWLNCDLFPSPHVCYVDIREPLPFPDGSVQFITAEHVIEHVEKEEAAAFFREAYRCLAGGGVMRLITPDLDKLIRLYRGEASVPPQTFLEHHRNYHGRPAANGCDWFNDHVRLWGHKYIYNSEALLAPLRRAGFEQVTTAAFGCSRHEGLNNVDYHFEGVEWMKSAYLLVVEASKSG
jgi:predicted SAM-dependent methyltransferase